MPAKILSRAWGESRSGRAESLFCFLSSADSQNPFHVWAASKSQSSASEEFKSLAVDFGERFELHRVEPPFTQLALGHIRLRLLETLGDLLLRESGGLASVPQPREKGLIPLGVDGLRHFRSTSILISWFRITQNRLLTYSRNRPTLCLVANNGERQRILVVDDDPSVRRVYQRTLDANGFEVVEASSGPIALALQAGGFSAIISDYGMPGMDGLSFVRELRARGVKAPVLIVSGELEIAPGAGGWPTGILSVLRKPFQVAELLNAVKLACEAPSSS